jgi:hypothetical protein
LFRKQGRAKDDERNARSWKEAKDDADDERYRGDKNGGPAS